MKELASLRWIPKLKIITTIFKWIPIRYMYLYRIKKTNSNYVQFSLWNGSMLSIWETRHLKNASNFEENGNQGKINIWKPSKVDIDNLATYSRRLHCQIYRHQTTYLQNLKQCHENLLNQENLFFRKAQSLNFRFRA